MTSNPVQDALSALLPDQTTVVASSEPDQQFRLLDAERPGTERMAEKRLREFCLGRQCAREAIRLVSGSPAAVPKGEQREPQWPAGIVGSISHTDTWAAAAVTGAGDLAGLGIDMEDDSELDPKLFPALLLPAEQELVASGRLTHAGKLLFSAKESLYKAIWPSVGRYVDFLEMEILPDTHESSFRVASHTDKVPPELAQRVRGRYTVTSGLVLTGAWLPA